MARPNGDGFPELLPELLPEEEPKLLPDEKVLFEKKLLFCPAGFVDAAGRPGGTTEPVPVAVPPAAPPSPGCTSFEGS